ncbi:MAG: translation elongation factor Ts [bacterium]
MSITASDVSKLRSITGAGMMDCKNALEESDNNIEQAGELLRKKGIIKAAKRSDKIASEGIVNVKAENNTAVVVEVNCETDFVSKNDGFKNVVDLLTAHLLANKPIKVDEALDQVMLNQQITVNDFLIESTAKIGEKISLRRFAIITKSDTDVFGEYIHMNGKIGSLIVLTNSSDSVLAKDIAMHSAAAAPKYLNRDQVPVEVIDKEKEIFTEQLKNEGKPENIIENIIKGKLNKFFEEVCLIDQLFIKDDKKKVSELLADGSVIKEYARFELGQGIEKKTADFVSEVQEQMG